LSIALALLLNGVATHSLSAQNESVSDHNLSQTEAKELAKRASTPDDHLKLAAYFRDHAQQEEAASRFDQQSASANQYNLELRIQSGMTYGTHMMSVPLLAVILVPTSSAQLSTEAPEHQMSKKEVKVPISNAKTAKDHQEIVTYFAQQGQMFDKKSREYQDKCVIVAEHPMNYKTKYPSAYDDCRFWGQYYALKFREAENARKLHEQLANGLAEGKR
jgi:hypothetical protein